MLKLDQITGHGLCFMGNVILEKTGGGGPGGLCQWDVNNLRLFITNSVGLEENDLGNGLQREGVSWGCLCN